MRTRFWPGWVRGPRRLALLLGAALAAQLVLPTLPALAAYDGLCHGFTDGSWACSFAEFAENQFALGLMLSIVFLAVILLGFMIGLAGGAVMRARQGR